MLLLDNIVFELQKAGGVSLVWSSILDACEKEQGFSYGVLDSGQGESNIFYPKKITDSRIIGEKGNLLFRRYKDVKTPDEFNLFHSSYFRVSSNANAKNVVTVHDFIYEKFNTGLNKYVHLWQKKRALKSADIIICVSQNTKDDLLDYHPDLVNRDIRVVHNGVGKDFRVLDEKDDGNNRQKPYLLYVGSRQKHKNFEMTLQLLKSSVALELELDLLVVGGGKFSKEELIDFKEKGLAELIKHVGHIDNLGLNKLYNDAYAFIYPSYYEGFGIPPLEAMAAGCPVICSNVSSIPEVVGDAGLMFTPSKSSDAIQHLESLQSDQFRADVIARGIARSRQFSWEKTGNETVKIYKEYL